MKHAENARGGRGKASAEPSAGAGHGTKLLLAAILVAGVAGGVYVVQAAVADGQSGGAQAGAPLNGDGDIVTVPLSDLSAQAKKYTTVLDGREIRYLAVRGSDGRPRAAFDGCDVCGGSSGFRQEGGDLVCNKCGKRFRMDDLGAKNLLQGGCMPADLPFAVADGNVVIRKADLSSGARLF